MKFNKRCKVQKNTFYNNICLYTPQPPLNHLDCIYRLIDVSKTKMFKKSLFDNKLNMYHNHPRYTKKLNNNITNKSDIPFSLHYKNKL